MGRNFGRTVRFDGSSVDLVVVSPRNGFVEATFVDVQQNFENT
jgi:hypothetical protein